MPLQGEFVPAGELPAVRLPWIRSAWHGFLLHADLDGAPIVLEDLLQLRRLLAAAPVDRRRNAGRTRRGNRRSPASVVADLELVRHACRPGRCRGSSCWPPGACAAVRSNGPRACISRSGAPVSLSTNGCGLRARTPPSTVS